MDYICKNNYTMKAVEFKSRVKNNAIPIPARLQTEINAAKTKDIRVIILMDETDTAEESDFRKMAKEQFLKGYDDADSVYDN